MASQCVDFALFLATWNANVFDAQQPSLTPLIDFFRSIPLTLCFSTRLRYHFVERKILYKKVKKLKLIDFAVFNYAPVLQNHIKVSISAPNQTFLLNGHDKSSHLCLNARRRQVITVPNWHIAPPITLVLSSSMFLNYGMEIRLDYLVLTKCVIDMEQKLFNQKQFDPRRNFRIEEKKKLHRRLLFLFNQTNERLVTRFPIGIVSCCCVRFEKRSKCFLLTD